MLAGGRRRGCSALLRASPPPKPQQPAGEVVARKEPAHVASRGVTAPPAAIDTVSQRHGSEVEPVPVWQALLDLRVWRSRPWWLRVAASLVVKRLSR
jgi:hypothetical protein